MTSIDRGYDACLATPFAVLGIRTGHDCVTGIEYLPLGAPTLAPVNALARFCCRELERYVKNPRHRFTMPVRQSGTDFQSRVWECISAIPLGDTRTYKDIALEIGTSARAVGNACGANSLPIVVPCHRVLATGGIGGFMHSRGGFPLQIKRWLLQHEGVR